MQEDRSFDNEIQVSNNSQSRRWILTINNEKRTDDELIAYIEDLEHFKYAIFQREKGELTGTEHIQLFIIFSIGKRFGTVKNYFPTAHIEKAKGSNAQCRDYCSKEETRLSGPYELGVFAEERARTDIVSFLDLIKAGADDDTLMSLYPTLYLKELNKVEKIRELSRFNEQKKNFRDVEVTYIYGPTRSGKTSYVINKYGVGNYFRVVNYRYGMFDMYNGEDVIIFDEFDSQIDITYMNNLCDRYPVNLSARFADKVACFTKVYIISNLPLSEVYKREQVEKLPIYNAFVARIDNIIRFDNFGNYSFIKKSDKSTQEDMEILFNDKEESFKS